MLTHDHSTSNISAAATSSHSCDAHLGCCIPVCPYAHYQRRSALLPPLCLQMGGMVAAAQSAGGMMPQQGMSLAQPGSLAPIPVQQAPPGRVASQHPFSHLRFTCRCPPAPTFHCSQPHWPQPSCHGPRPAAIGALSQPCCLSDPPASPGRCLACCSCHRDSPAAAHPALLSPADPPAPPLLPLNPACRP